MLPVWILLIYFIICKISQEMYTKYLLFSISRRRYQWWVKISPCLSLRTLLLPLSPGQTWLHLAHRTTARPTRSTPYPPSRSGSTSRCGSTSSENMSTWMDPGMAQQPLPVFGFHTCILLCSVKYDLVLNIHIFYNNNLILLYLPSLQVWGGNISWHAKVNDWKRKRTTPNLSVDNTFTTVRVCVAGSLQWTAAWVNAISWWGVTTLRRWTMETTWTRRTPLPPTWPPMSAESLYLQVRIATREK